ncbi:MAG: tripartite tricarboxylate transporter substrate binding protein, partial [Betaproteobacteria bacterium]
MFLKTSIRRFVAGASGAFAALALAAGVASAQSTAWPDRAVRLVVTVGAGGAADTLARNLSNGFTSVANGQALVV